MRYKKKEDKEKINNNPKLKVAPQVLIMGPPGCGRQSQAKLLAEHFGLVHVSVRKLLRAEIKRHPETGKITKAAMENGSKIPD